MAEISEQTIADEILQIARSCGYEVTSGVSNSRDRVFGWFKGRTPQPDIKVRNGTRLAIIEIKLRPVVMYDVFQIAQARGDRFTGGAIICVPTHLLPHIQPSTRAYAEELDVRLCASSDIGEELTDLLE